jgi:hypothetical protein
MVGRDLPRPEYPRPQFRRESWTNLNGEWRFAFDDESVGLTGGWQNVSAQDLGAGDSPFDRMITVPFCSQAKLSGIGETVFHDVVWYARTFEHPVAEDEHLLLHFGAVDYRATVWVNGAHVASHEGGHTPFSADVNHALIDGDNVLVVRVEDPSRDVTIPRGKQYWREEPEGIFYTRTTGIWQTVWLELVGRRRIGSLRLTPNLDAAALDVEVGVEGFEPGMTLRLTVVYEGERVLDDRVGLQSALVERRLPLVTRGEQPASPYPDRWGKPPYWSPEKPNLLDLNVELLDAESRALDTVNSYFGMRKIEIRDGKVYLNDRPLYQRLVLDQGYFPDGILTALARMTFRGKDILFAGIIATLFIPQFVFLMPNYLIVDYFGWLDTLLAVIVPGAAGAFGVFFLRQFFLSLPQELEEAALIDGANRYQIFLRIILPLSRAPLATLAVLSVLTNWNDFLWPVYVLFSPQNLTLPPGLSILQGAYNTNYTVIMAGGVIASIPVLVLYLFAQRYIIEGVSRSGLKG